MKQYTHLLCLLIALVLLSACSVGTSDGNKPHTTADGIVKPNLAQTQPVHVNVLTNRYNNARTGSNLNETVLTPENVNVDQFGKLFTRSVEGDVYAQPLYVQDLDIPGKGKQNVVFVATMHNMVYGFDADDPTQTEPLWSANLGTPFTQNVFYDIPGGEIGVLSTPVIDLSTETIYLVSRNWENEQALYKLNALDIRTGEHKFGSPKIIKLSMPGKGYVDADGIIELDSFNQLQRTGLLLLNGHIFFGFGSNNDRGNWFGWLPAYRADNLELDGIFNVSPDGYQGGIWMGGTGIASDGEYLYLAAANGVNTVANGGRDYAMSLLKLKYDNKKFNVVDYYLPTLHEQYSKEDTGLGSTGVILVPNTNLMVAGGKDGNLYVADQKHLGGFDSRKDTSLQTIPNGAGQTYDTPVTWESGPNDKPTVYAWNMEDTIRAYGVNQRTQGLVVQPSSVSRIKADGRPTGAMALSANGNAQATGILWVLYAPRASQGDLAGELVALDATNLTKILWSSELNKVRDELGTLAKFNPATIANGKVYVGTFSNRLDVYGLLPK